MKDGSTFKNKNVKPVIDWYKTYEYFLFAVGFFIIAMAMRVCNFNFKSNDYNTFLLPWFEEIKAAGGLSGFASTVGDYTPMYKYIITLITYIPIDSLYSYKIVSCIFDVIMAVYVGLIIRHITKNDLKALLSYAVILFLPNVFLNSAVWAQCDAIFSCFCIMSFYYMIKDRGNLSMVFYAIAFSFKIQAIFFAPAVVIALLRGKLKPLSLLFFPLTYFLCAVPAMIAGMGIFDALLGAYVKQLGEWPNLTLNAPNLYQILPAWFVDDDLSKMMIFFSIGVCAIFCTVFYKARYETNEKNLLIIAYMMSLVLPFVLPHMHERYFYLSDIFAVLFAFTFKKKSYISVATIYCSLRALIVYLYDGGASRINFPQVAFLELAAIVALCVFAMKEMKPKEEENEKLPPLSVE